MALSTRLELRQGQQLVMTPQLQQAIKLLQLSNMELGQYVETELERNPLLEREEGADAPLPAPATEAVVAVENGDADYEPPALDLSKPAAETAASTFDTDHDNVYPDDTRTDIMRDAATSGWENVRQSTSSNSFGDETNNLEAYVSAEVSLKDHLTEQMTMALSDPVERIIGQHIVDMIDDAGYIQGDIDALAVKLGVPEAMVARVLGVVQTFEPTGVGARSLAECLALQLKEQDRFDPLMQGLVDNLGLLAAHNLTALRRAVGVDADDLADMIQDLKQLNPKPGLKFGSVQMQPVLPDVQVRAARDGSWIVELNNDTLPRVLVNRSYYTMVSRTVNTDKDKGYLTECLASANWLVKSLDQRARTILRVAEEIVRQQDGFLAHGVQHMRPLNLKTVAEKIGMHESTVSRVTSNKYMATPRGIYELKFFFTSSINAEGEGEAYSSEAVRHRIKLLIDAENPADILSDDKLVEKLRIEGIDIARRTVAKYREGMRLASSVQRRREKQMAAKLLRREAAE
jgi:RNA polymerase sigma-54 factor